MRGVDDGDDADEEADGLLALGVAMMVAMVSRECISIDCWLLLVSMHREGHRERQRHAIGVNVMDMDQRSGR